MLRLQMLPLVNQMVSTRDELIGKHRKVHASEFNITIEGQTEREDDETKRVVKPVLEMLLAARIARLNSDLGVYGVDVGTGTEPSC